MAIAEATKEAIYMRGFLGEIRPVQKSIVLYNDDQRLRYWYIT
jgi:hypothetical protein